MKSQRLGLLMIAASLIVIAVILFLLVERQAESRRGQMRAQGLSLVRSISGIPYDQLLPKENKGVLLQALLNVKGNPDFGYGILIDTQGKTIGEVTAPGTLIPNAPLSVEPAAWYGEQALVSPGDGRKIREFYGPVLNNGALQGFVRLGYFEPKTFNTEQISFLSMLALPIFLLVPLFYFLIRRETKPLDKISQQLEEIASMGPAKVQLNASGEMGDFVQNFNKFMQTTKQRIGEFEGEKMNMIASNRMLSYKKDKIETVLQAIPEAVVVMDETGNANFANAKVEPILGVKAEEIVGNNPEDWCQSADVRGFLSRYLQQNKQSWRTASMEYAPPNAPDRRVAVSVFPLFSTQDSSETQGSLIIFRDITQDHLAKNIGAEFVAQVSHELKTPLNTLAMYSETLLSDAGKDESIRVEAINVIHDEVERMSSLINNLLSISKMELGNISLERKLVRLVDLLKDTFDNLAQSGRGQDLKFSVKLPPDLAPVALDKDLFRIAVNNLLTNAIKYNQPGGSVILSAEEIDDQILIRVRDSGIGISAEDKPRIFDKFFRASNSDAAKRGGHGLGLYLAREIVELHHGKLSVQSELGKGTEFSIVIKKAPVRAAGGATA
jgi:PAS domain S-box-containing protein